MSLKMVGDAATLIVGIGMMVWLVVLAADVFFADLESDDRIQACMVEQTRTEFDRCQALEYAGKLKGAK